MSALRVILLPLLLTGLVFTPGVALGQFKRPDNASRSNAKLLETFQPVVTKASKSTVSVLCDDKFCCLGTIVDADGFIVTKDSELKSTKITIRLKSGKEFTGKKVAAHEPFDLAMIKIEVKDLVPVEWSFSRVAPVGNWVASAGLGSDPVSIGVVSVAARKLPPAPRQLPPDAKRGYMGIQMEPVEQGPRVTVVTPKSPAEKGGLKAGDIVLSVDGVPVDDPESLSSLVQSYAAGEKISLKVLRGRSEVEAVITLDPRPKDPGSERSDFQNNLGGPLSTRRGGFPLALQHDSPLKPADCGGPLVDLEGRVIGVNIARGGRTDSYAIPSEAILPLMSDLMAGKSTVMPATKILGDFEQQRRIAENLVKDAEAGIKAIETERQAAERRLAIAKAALERIRLEEKAAKEKAEREAKMERLPPPRVVEKK